MGCVLKLLMCNFILDFECVLSIIKYLYSNDRKEYKIFGPFENDGLKLFSSQIGVSFISTDDRRFNDISIGLNKWILIR